MQNTAILVPKTQDEGFGTSWFKSKLRSDLDVCQDISQSVHTKKKTKNPLVLLN